MNAIDLLYGDASLGRETAALPVEFTREQYLEMTAIPVTKQEWSYLD